MTQTHSVKFFRSIGSVRTTTLPVFAQALSNKCKYFDIDMTKVDDVVDFLINIINRDYKSIDDIPPHGRWQHLNAGNHKRVETLIAQWERDGVSKLEISKRLIDLFVFSVLIDAGAGNNWKYTEPIALEVYERSEGLAVASIDMFINGTLSSDDSNPYQVDGNALLKMNMESFVRAFQITKENPLAGEEGRLKLIQSLGDALCCNQIYFGEQARPGNLMDYLLTKQQNMEIDLNTIWDALMDGLTPIWPEGRTTIGGIALGDVWPLDSKPNPEGTFVGSLVTFHKLTQWLCYSLLVPIKLYGFSITNEELQTGLPEYRNGGLFYDFGVLTLKEEYLTMGLKLSATLGWDTKIPSFTPDNGVIVEWRCLTIGFLDYLLPLVNEKLGSNISLPQMIEAGTWKAGREIAAQLRPKTKGPPIELNSDGTVF